MKLKSIFSALMTVVCSASLLAAEPAAKPAAPAPAPTVEELLAFIPEVAATIDGKVAVTRADLLRDLKPMLTQALAQGMPVQQEQVKMFVYNQAENLALTQVVLAAAKKAGFKADEAAAKQQLEAIINQVNNQEPADPKRFDAEIAKMGLTRELFLEKLCEQNILQQYLKAVTDAVKLPPVPTEAQAKKFYVENQDALKKPETLSAAHILVQFPNNKPSADEKAAALKKINDLKAQLKTDGSNFADIAKANSDCPSKSNGGDLGQFPRGAMVKEFEDALLKMKAGEISGPVETIFGYHLIKAGVTIPEHVTPFAEAKDQIIAHLKQQAEAQAKGAAVEARIAKLRAESKIEVKIEKPAPPALPAAAGAVPAPAAK